MGEAVQQSAQEQHVITGRVVSNKMDKTAVVMIERKVKHRIYKKYLKRKTTYYVHDEDNVCKMGDLISFVKTRPYSKQKHWALLRVEDKSVIA